MVIRHPLHLLRMIMRIVAHCSIMAAGLVLLAAFFFVVSPCRAQVGFTAFVGGTNPAGDFGETVVERGKSGAEEGHSFGGGVVWRWRIGREGSPADGFSSAVVFSLGYSESGFGDNVPSSIVNDTLYATPHSRITVRGVRLGLRVIPWAGSRFSPSIGGGLQRQILKWKSRAFYGPGPESTVSFTSVGQSFTHKSDNILGSFVQAGLVLRMDESAMLFADVVRHFLFSQDKAVTTEFKSPDGTGTFENTIKYNYQWWELRAGLVWFF